jgi:hypothetical protein
MLVPDIVVSELPDTAYVPEPEVGETVSVMLQLQFEPDVVQVALDVPASPKMPWEIPPLPTSIA